MIKKYLVLTNDKSNSIIFKLFYKCYKKKVYDYKIVSIMS